MNRQFQDDAHVQKEVGNLFLTNVHRVFLGDVRAPSLDDDLREYVPGGS